MTNANTPTLLFIPGLLSDATAWRDVAAHFSDDFPVTIADVSPGVSMTHMAEQILAPLQGPLIPIGHSMGGRVALEIQRLVPQRTVGVILADTGVHPLKDGEIEKREAIIALAHDKGMGALADVWLPPMVAEANQSNDQLMSELRNMVLRSDPETHERQIRALISRPDARIQLDKLTCPVLLLVGEEDRWSPPDQHAEMAKHISKSHIGIIKDAGHFAPAEKPEAVAAAIMSWLRAGRF